MWRALALFALVCVIAGLLIVAIFADDTSGTGVRYSPPIYTQCVGNAHHSDICLGA